MKKLLLPIFIFIFQSSINAQMSSVLYKKVNGISIAYHKTGAGPELVLLHGFTQDSRVWKKQIESLSKYFTVIAWDAPGAGLSADPPRNFNMSNWADCLSGLLDSLNIKRAHILGISWGGVLAQEFYQRYPNKVTSLILAGTNEGWSSISDSVAKSRLDACLHDASLSPNELAQKYLPSMFSDSVKQEVKDTLGKIISDTRPGGFKTMAAAIATADTRKVLPLVKVPALLIWGESDKRAPLTIAHQMQTAIPGSKLELISNAGHMCNMEQPEHFNKIVKEFCFQLAKKK